MKLSTDRINSLRAVLLEIGLEYEDEQIQDAGMAIMRFVLAKRQRADDTIKLNGEN